MSIFEQIMGRFTKGFSDKFLNDAAKLLVGNREEKFEYERAILLFQFRTWIFAPAEETIRYAGLIAATKLLRTIETDWYLPEGISDGLPDITLDRIIDLRGKTSYWDLYNKIIGAYGGLTALLETPRPRTFDSAIQKQKTKAKVVADLVEYRLRYALHGQGSAKGANINHAMFFNWWPTHTLPGKRGVTAKNKSVSPRTMSAVWSSLKESTIFVYLHERQGFRLSPPETDVEADSFVRTISVDAKELAEVRRLFGAYAYIAEAIQHVTGEPPYITIPQELPRVPISVPVFSDVEQRTISEYDENNLDMWQ
jgi:hypothetical protein